MDQGKNTLPTILGGLVIGAIFLGGGVALINNNDSSTTNINNPEVIGETTSANPPEETSDAVLVYNNGEYTAKGSYTSPAGDEEVEVILNVENNTVTAVTVNTLATNPVSVKLQNAFSEGVSDVIVGKTLDEVEYPRVVNGSSLTGEGFINAVEEIKTQALI